MDLELKDRVVIITGGSGYLGSEMCRGFAREGAKVVISDLNDKKGEALKEQLIAGGSDAIYIHTDVGDIESAVKMHDEALAWHGHIDVLVNNAGINVMPETRLPIDEFEDLTWDRIMNVDLNGTYNCSKPILKTMMAAGSGRIVNIASVVGSVVPFRNQCAYAAAKNGILQLTRAMALEGGPHGVSVNAIAPGTTIPMEIRHEIPAYDQEKKQGFFKSIPLGRPAIGSEQADAVLFLSSAARASYINGIMLTVDGGWTCGFAQEI